MTAPSPVSKRRWASCSSIVRTAPIWARPPRAPQGRPGVELAGVLAGAAPAPPVDGTGHDGHPRSGAVAPQPDPLGVDLGAGAQVREAGPHVLDLLLGHPLAAWLPPARPG